jgi:hypothetical protein
MKKPTNQDMNNGTGIANTSCELCNSPILTTKHAISYSVFLYYSEGNRRYSNRDIRIVCRHCYLNSEQINRSIIIKDV